MLGATIDDATGDTSGSDTDGTGSEDTQNLPIAALKLLQQADAKFTEADKALKAGDLTGYSEAIQEARALVERALAAKQ